MTNSNDFSPVVLQVLPELEMGGVERGTVEIATYLQKKALKTLWLRKADVWYMNWNATKFHT